MGSRRLRRGGREAARRGPERALRRPRGRRRAGAPGRVRLGAGDPVPRLRPHRREPEAARRLLGHHRAPRRDPPARGRRDDLRQRPHGRRAAPRRPRSRRTGCSTSCGPAAPARCRAIRTTRGCGRSTAERSPRRSSAVASGSSCRRWARRGRSTSRARSSSSRTRTRRRTTSTASSSSSRTPASSSRSSGVVVGQMEKSDYARPAAGLRLGALAHDRGRPRGAARAARRPGHLRPPARAREAPRGPAARRHLHARRRREDAHGRRAGSSLAAGSPRPGG